jgi:hypothetical protein
MKTLRIEGLVLECDYNGGDALKEAQSAIAAANRALSELGGDMALFEPGTLVAMVREDTDEDGPDEGREEAPSA